MEVVDSWPTGIPFRGIWLKRMFQILRDLCPQWGFVYVEVTNFDEENHQINPTIDEFETPNKSEQMGKVLLFLPQSWFSGN